jgi:glutamyl-tRNA synthetase
VLHAGVVNDANGRYAPSPTGPLHLGNLRTALLAWLFARSRGGAFMLRIDDLDPQRSRREFEGRAIADLAALGLDWDGEPVRQSDRRDEHRLAFERLREHGHLYPCWCSRAEVRRAAQAPHSDESAVAYPGTCRRLSARERAERLRSSRPVAWRLDAQGAVVEFADRLAGTISTRLDDFVVWRSDGVAAYHLAVVVDDAAIDVREVVRGDDLRWSTPGQIQLARLLELSVPRYAHVPLLIGADGERLAKRHGTVTLDDRLGCGQSVAAILGMLAHSAGLLAAPTPCSAHELLERFDPARLRRTPFQLRLEAH